MLIEREPSMCHAKRERACHGFLSFILVPKKQRRK